MENRSQSQNQGKGIDVKTFKISVYTKTHLVSHHINADASYIQDVGAE